jgi:hypothetical protein
MNASAGIVRSKQTTIRIQTGIVLGTALLLLVPALGMLLSDEMAWGPGDFVAAAVLLSGTALTYELATRRIGKRAHRIGIGLLLAVALLAVWAELAVGIVGD